MPFDVEPLRRQLRQQQRSFGRVASELTVSALRSAAPTKTHELERSIKATQPSVSDRRVEFTAETGDLIQAETTEKGARPHVIVPRSKRALSFYWRKAGRVVVLKKVNHPGNPARPWFAPTVARWPDIAARAWRRVAR